ncbi:ATP-binding cassette subfamily G member 4 [Homalodisca vitripennis]|uniref:ATP-binding cassette subfamily G member 4 n=1 Tax=Homalodisca vitripennis TaxID=197043 RepID=UPI001EEC1EC1|nr:ATP-binding cassette subfamily G member 4 [Homalodisca vitripennis]
MDVEFRNLTFKVDRGIVPFFGNRDGGRKILKSVSGRFKAGELSAILGPSGAGKSSLLNAISGLRSKGVTGELLVNGLPKEESKFRKMSCYITQEDLLQPMLTLNELMMFAADLKLSSSTRKEKKLVVGDIQATLGLSECKYVRTENLSGGQKKRLCIALELINNPSILFLDEPTSGLDNVTTSHTLRLLRTLAHQGRTIVCTIHQPSASLFQLFDHVYVLAAGLCVYQGPTRELVPFLSAAGLRCPTYYNPADFIIEMTDGEEEDNIIKLSQATDNGKSTSYLDNQDNSDNPHNRLRGRPSETDENKRHLAAVLLNHYNDQRDAEDSVCAQTWCCWVQFCTLFRRKLLQIRRNTLGLKIQLFHHMICSLLVGIIFFDRANDGEMFFDHMKFCMGIILFHAYTHVMVPVLTFPYEVKLLAKEHFNQWYGLKPYYMALTLSRVPSLVIFSLLFLVIVYTMSGLPRDLDRFIVFCAVGIITSLIAEGMGLAIGSVFNVTNGCAVGPMTLAPFLGFAIYGFDFARSIPFWLWPMLKASFMRSGVIAMIIAVFGMNRPKLECHNEIMYCHFNNPQVVLHYLNLDKTSPWIEILTMIVILLVFRSLCYLGLRWRVST